MPITNTRSTVMPQLYAGTHTAYSKNLTEPERAQQQRQVKRPLLYK